MKKTLEKLEETFETFWAPERKFAGRYLAPVRCTLLGNMTAQTNHIFCHVCAFQTPKIIYFSLSNILYPCSCHCFVTVNAYLKLDVEHFSKVFFVQVFRPTQLTRIALRKFFKKIFIQNFHFNFHYLFILFFNFIHMVICFKLT